LTPETYPEWSCSIPGKDFSGEISMNKNVLKAVIAGSLVASLGMGATAAHAANASATAKAKILRQVTVTNTTDLQFGTIVSSPAQATVIVSTTGTRTCGTGLVCTGASTAAGFNVTGTTGQIVTVVVPGSVTLTSGSNSMTAALATSATSLTLANSAGSFSVGGTLTVGADQSDGDYQGTFNVTADYQ
jgi:Mat/Ecp fimbriae major subunit